MDSTASAPVAESSTDKMYYIGIGASAGGLEAATLLAQNLPKSANAAYILAQHMSPTHKSLLVTLLARETHLDVVEITDGVEALADTLYVIPPNSDAIVEAGKLWLRQPQGHAAMPKPSADRLFASIAKDCGERCMAIVLSGTGSDGAYGVRSVREAGGITLAQEPSTAKYDGMPVSSIDTGCVDLTLSPEQMGEHLERILDKPDDLGSLRQADEKPSRLTDLFQVLLARTKIDFRDYKDNTVNRRISRRMVALGIEDYDEYVDLCRQSEEEVEALHRDLLISVTRFFRDPDQFEQLSETINRIVRNHTHGTIRVWVAGCATGEEAYSIAILFAQAMGGLKALAARGQALQIFASDIDERALDVARQGIYPVTAANDVPVSFLDEYFEIDGNHLHIVQPIRNLILFSRHNLAQDPPFINVDLVSLRNVLIYFNPTLQERVLSRVHYALDPKGALFLGTSESVGSMQAYFESTSDAPKVFRKRQVQTRQKIALTELSSQVSGAHRVTNAMAVSRDARKSQDAEKLALFDVLAKAVAPNGFIATNKNQIIRVFGDISRIVEITENTGVDTNLNILRQGLREEASVLINIALRNMETREGRWHNSIGSNKEQIRLKAYPLPTQTGGEDSVLLALEAREQKEIPPAAEAEDGERTEYVRQLERDMENTREALEHTVEELQTSNEELQSVNEEMQSTNEELQATNEELETSNEELQSTNEELITVNEEMQVNSSELQKVTTELSALLAYAPYPILVIDQALLIRRMSETAQSFFKIIEIPSAGLHVAQCILPEGFPALAPLCIEVLRNQEPTTTQVKGAHKIYSLMLAPFQDTQGTILGLKLSLHEAVIEEH